VLALGSTRSSLRLVWLEGPVVGPRILHERTVALRDLHHESDHVIVEARLAGLILRWFGFRGPSTYFEVS
jgi:hypothetical protein